MNIVGNYTLTADQCFLSYLTLLPEGRGHKTDTNLTEAVTKYITAAFSCYFIFLHFYLSVIVNTFNQCLCPYLLFLN